MADKVVEREGGGDAGFLHGEGCAVPAVCVLVLVAGVGIRAQKKEREKEKEMFG